MTREIYIQLLNEGTKVYRPVNSEQIGENVFIVGGFDLYDPEDELWEFSPGTVVLVSEKNLEGDFVLVAIKEKI